jgi:hypothetical protein
MLALLVAAVAVAAVAIAVGGRAGPTAHVGQISFQPCLLSSDVTVLKRGTDSGLRTTARQALHGAFVGQPSYMFTGAKAQPVPPHGNWQVDKQHSQPDEIQLDRVSVTGDVNWVALVDSYTETVDGTVTQRGWYYFAGSPWPSHDRQCHG